MPELSVIIPIKNEESNLKTLNNDLTEALKEIDYEIIWVDDGSTDKSTRIIRDFADRRTILVELCRNYGQSQAMKAGIDHSSAHYIAFLDGDGQNDPGDIPAMLSLIKKEKWDLVAGIRKDRKDHFLMRKIPSTVANKMIRVLTGVHIKDYGCTLKLVTREKAKLLDLQKGMHRFIPVLIKQAGGTITQVDVKHHPRINGESKYGLERTFSVIRDLLLLSVKKKSKISVPKKYYSVKKVYNS
jgi:glycosyltransferase involved in cell wall biosynthesis